MKEIREFDKVRENHCTGTVIITVGLPRSGKSTWSEAQGLPIVSKDAIRLALHGQRYDALMEPMVSGLCPLMVDALFHAGHKKIILDECNITQNHREKWKQRGYKVKVKVFLTSVEECKRRAVLTGQEDLFPVIDFMAKDIDWDIPEEDCYNEPESRYPTPVI